MATTQALSEDLSRAERIYNLVVELNNAKREKKATVAAHNDNIKRIQAEINEIINEEPAQTEETN